MKYLSIQEFSQWHQVAADQNQLSLKNSNG